MCFIFLKSVDSEKLGYCAKNRDSLENGVQYLSRAKGISVLLSLEFFTHKAQCARFQE